MIHYKKAFLISLLLMLIGCDSVTDSNEVAKQHIYDFMKIVIEEQELNLNHGLRIKPELDFDISKTDEENFKSFLNELESKNKIETSDTLDWIFDYKALSTLSDFKKEDIFAMIQQKENIKEFEWDNSKLGFNLSNENNWYSFSVPLFSKDKNKAVMKISSLCQGLCGTGNTVVFTKKNGKWTSATTGLWLH